MITFMPSHDEIEAKIANEAAFIKKEGFARAFVYPGQ